jgi:hypothetical protein
VPCPSRWERTLPVMLLVFIAAIAAGIAWFILDNRARMIETA